MATSVAPRFRSAPRFLWRQPGAPAVVAHVRELTATSAVLLTASPARVGDELRFDLVDDGDVRLAAGLARVTHLDARGMAVEILALGIDPQLVVAMNSVVPRARGAMPPPLPMQVPKAPKLPDIVLPEPSEPPRSAGDSVPPQIEFLEVKTGLVIGIDLGTTNTCASYVKDGRPQVIPGRTGTNFIPSMITFDKNGTVHVGQRAADRQVMQPLRTVYGSKRLLGRTYRQDIADDIQRHFAYPLAEADGQRFGVRIDDRVVSIDSLAARVLDEVRASAEAHLGQTVEAAVITVPAYFTEVQRDAVRRAAREANLVVHRIVNEPTAAAVAYGHKQGQNARIAVWDFGGGTFDFSVVDVKAGVFEVLATGGDAFLGGSDFDDLVASHLLAEFQRATGVTFEPDAQQVARLREAADAAKRLLSTQSEALVELPELTRNPRRDLSVEITRAAFEAMTRSLVERTVEIASEVMRSAKVDPSAIDDIVLVGGTSRIPAVQDAVATLFGRRPSKRINPDEAVALGAALLADELANAGGPTLIDILPMSVGRGQAGRKFLPIVPRYSRLPVEQEITIDADILGSVQVPLFQGDAEDVTQNEYLCTAMVEDKSLWDKGRVTLRLSFDDHCVMAVDARDARTGRALPLKLDRSRSVQDVLAELGAFQGAPAETWKLPESKLGAALGKLARLFGRK